MKDLEIRGAGNLLGGEQSGHIADVGFDLYVRLVGEAVAEYRKGDAAAEEVADVKVELPDRRPHPARLRRRASGCGSRPTSGSPPPRTDADVDEVAEELVDRYGPAPRAGGHPARGRPVPGAGARGRPHRGRGRRANGIRFAPVELPESRADAAAAALPGHPRQAGDPYDRGAASDDRPRGRAAAARHRPAVLGGRPRRRRPARAGSAR